MMAAVGSVGKPAVPSTPERTYNEGEHEEHRIVIRGGKLYHNNAELLSGSFMTVGTARIHLRIEDGEGKPTPSEIGQGEGGT